MSSNVTFSFRFTRFLCNVVWTFSVLLVSIYTANLAAFLTVTRLTTPIEELRDLADQREISYGTIAKTSLSTFFQVLFPPLNRIECLKHLLSTASKHFLLQNMFNVKICHEHYGVASHLYGGFRYVHCLS